MGEDCYKEFEKWKDFEEIKRLAPLIVFQRGRNSIIPAFNSTSIRDRLANVREEDNRRILCMGDDTISQMLLNDLRHEVPIDVLRYAGNCSRCFCWWIFN